MSAVKKRKLNNAGLKEIVEAVTIKRLPYQKTSARRNGQNISVPVTTYRYHRLFCSKTIPAIERPGLNKRFSHLKPCFASKETMIRLYCEAFQKIQLCYGAGILRSYFQAETASQRDRAVFGFIEMIFMKNHPLSVVEDPLWRRVSKFSSLLTIKNC